MSCQTECCVFLRGELFISDNCIGEGGCDGLSEIVCETNKPFKKVGNVSSCLVEISSQVNGKINKYNPTTSMCARAQVSGVNLTITFNCASKENLYRALYSELPTQIEDENSEEFCISTLEKCDFFPFAKKIVDPETLVITLKDAMGDEVKVLVADVDYTYSPSGVEMLVDIDIEDATTLTMEYEYNEVGYFDIYFMSKYQGYKTVYFKGTNYDSDGPGGMFDAVFHKVLFAPINQFDLITRDEFLTLTLTGSVEEQDGSWFKITKQEG